MADVPQNAKAREDWRRVNAHIHQEEQKLKELQLDYSEKVAVVEALKLELRQAKNEAQDCEQRTIKLGQATIAAHRKSQELQKQWGVMQVDRGLLMHQLSAEQDGLKADQIKLEDAKVIFQEELQALHAYLQMLQQQLGMPQQQQDKVSAVEEEGPDERQQQADVVAEAVDAAAVC